MRSLHRTAVVTAVVVSTSLLAAGTAAAYYALTSSPSTTTHAVASLTAPQGLVVTPSLTSVDGVADLTWSAPASPAGASGLRYTVLRGTTPVCSGVAVASCRDTGLLPGSSYTWTVQALLGAWSGPAATASATVPVARALAVSAPSTARAGTAFDVTLTATDQGRPDTAAVGTRTLTVTGPSAVGAHQPTSSVAVTFATQADGAVRGTATVTLFAAEATTLTFTDPSAVGRSGTSGEVVVSPQTGSSVFADCQGPAGYSCGDRTQLAGSPVSGVIARDAVDPLGNPLPLPAESITLTIKNDRKGDLTQVVSFAEGATTSERWSFQPEVGAQGNVRVTATAPAWRTAPPTISLRL